MDMMQARTIEFQVGGKSLLSGVDFHLRPGRLVALLGPNGAGKSTLLKVMAGILKPEAGSVWLNGLPIWAWPRREEARLRAVVLQESHLPFPFTVEEVVLMGRHPHVTGNETARDWAIVRGCLFATDTLHLRDRIFPTLSGGERQRVHWARALAQLDYGSSLEGKYLLLDEPTSSLDLSHQHQLLELARNLSRAGAGVFVILHDLNLAARYADTMVLMKDGRVVAAASPEEVLTPETILDVFGIRARVLPHPDSGTLFVLIQGAGCEKASSLPAASRDLRFSFNESLNHGE